MEDTRATTKPEARPREVGEVRHRNDRPGYRVRITWDGTTIERSAGKTWQAAESKRRAAALLLEQGIPLDHVLASVFGDFHGSKLTFREAVPEYLKHAKTRKRASTYTDDTYRLGAMKRATWTAKPLAKIEPKDLLGWVAERQKAGASNSTANRDLALVSALFRWAIGAGYLEENPARKVERLSEKGRAREVYLTAKEARALLGACSPILRPIVLAALHTGARRGELLALTWNVVDLERREVRITADTEKAGRGRSVPMTDELHAALDAMREARKAPAIDGSDAVFALSDGVPLTASSLRLLWEPTVEHCQGIPLAKREAFRFHDLRHTAASLMAAEGVPLLDLARILGHSTLAVTMRYAHFAPKSGREAIKKLGKALRPKQARKPRKPRKTA